MGDVNVCPREMGFSKCGKPTGGSGGVCGTSQAPGRTGWGRIFLTTFPEASLWTSVIQTQV